MITLHVSAEGKILAIVPEGGLLPDASPPEGTAASVDIDPETNAVIAGLLNSAAILPQLAVTKTDVTFLAQKILIAPPGQGAKTRQTRAAAIAKLQASTAALSAAEIRLLLQMIAERLGLRS
jgi:hypothetical protein